MQRPQLLLIETSTEVCSVALSRGNCIVAEREIKEHKAHARVISTFIEEVLSEASSKIGECDAVVVSEGPGSYTGLRVGVSIAKGLCYGAGIQLVAVSSLELLARLCIAEEETPDGNFCVVPMIDARRMEVYASVYDQDCKALAKTEAHILTEESFSSFLAAGPVIFTGDGAVKAQEVIKHQNAIFKIAGATARGMLLSALEKYERAEFADVAYFEPFYLKDFIAGISKRSLL
jgi:tRNA threonylcarbamoyladenosine biosynthesis protein TsaB